MGFNIFFVGTKTYENFVKYGYNLLFNSCTIADLLNILKKNIIFRILGKLKKNLKKLVLQHVVKN